MGKKRKLYDDYDYEEAYNEQRLKLTEWEAEQIARQGKGAAYRTTTTKAGKQIEVDIYPSFGSRHDMPRTRRRRESRPSQKNLNARRSRRYLNNLAAANFGKGDLWGTFTYRAGEEPESVEAAERIFGNFIKRINRRRKKRGKGNLRYIYVTEYSDDQQKGIRVHHHMIFCGDCDRDEIEKLWYHGDRTETKRLAPDPDTHITGLVNYIAKDPKGHKRWKSSKNLKKPVVTRSYSRFGKNKVRKMAFDHAFLEKELKKEYKNARFIDASVFVNEINGGFYIYARMVRD
ncbi:MAG: hypothetical protein NC548_26555 [Lachnospiraceae bacterium]|nr:hypothetical protein [Lachnospiraceae bacterium]